MKLLYLVNARIPTPRAYGLQILKTCEAFAGAGVSVALVVPTRSYKSPEDPFLYYGVQKLFNITTLGVPDFLKFGALGFFASAVWFAEKARWLQSFWEADVIYARDPMVLIQYVLLGRSLVFEAHARPSFISRIVARRARAVVVISRGLAHAYERAGIPPEKIIVAPDAVDEHLFDIVPTKNEARQMLGLPPETPLIVYAGHLYPRKGAATLAAAAVLVPEATFLFVGGSGEEVADFRKKWKNQTRIKILGHLPYEKVPLYLRSADVLVLPNSGKDEDAARFTSPMKLFEYMASGTPIVASDVPAVREILDDTMAILVTPDDPTELARGVRTTLARPEEARGRAHAAYAEVGDYTWEKRVETILARLKSK